ncbi:MAG: MBL fold metallo-hydrolase [Thermoproteota archaeon]
MGNRRVRIGVPESERKRFEDVASYWNDPSHRWHIYNFHPHHLMLSDPVPVHETYRDGDVIEWGGVRISVMSTPGHTDGSVSYLVDADGIRVAFCGDLIHEGGRLLDLYSLQKGSATMDYHGFLGARSQLFRSFRKIMEARPSVLVPSHGSLIFHPECAIDTLISRISSCYDRYASISALRFYFPELFSEYENNPNMMPIRSCKQVPEFLHHFGTT